MCKLIFRKFSILLVLVAVSFSCLVVGCGKKQDEKDTSKTPDMSEFDRLEELTSPREPEAPKPKLPRQEIIYEKSYLGGFVTYMRAKREPDKKGRPAANSTVYVYEAYVEEDEEGRQTYKEGGFVKDIVTGTDGSYKMELDPGAYVVVVYDEKARSSGPVFLEVKEGETKKQDIQLPGF